MYIPDYFKVTDKTVIDKFITENAFATLISSGAEYPMATHIPLELETNDHGDQMLTGHLAKANPHWRSFAQFPNVTAIFLWDITHYISSSWYDHPNAPTWNYISVHVSGSVSILDDERRWQSVKRLTDRYEQNSSKPVSLETLPKNIQAELNGLVAFEIKVEKVEAAFKLSQNRNDESFARVLAELRKLNDHRSLLLADVMESFRKK